MEKRDYRKRLKHLYGPSAKKVEIVQVPQMSFLMIDGDGDPNTSQSFSDAIETLFSLSYTLKFMVKKGETCVDYGVLPLEALWWADDMSAFSTGNKDAWKWTSMIMQPELITPEMVEEAAKEVKRKKNPAYSCVLYCVLRAALRSGSRIASVVTMPMSISAAMQ